MANLTNITIGNDSYDIPQGGGGGASVLKIEIPTFSSLPQTVTDSRITASHFCKPNDFLLTNAFAANGDWTVTTSDGSLVLSGSMVADTQTSATLWLTKEV